MTELPTSICLNLLMKLDNLVILVESGDVTYTEVKEKLAEIENYLDEVE